MADFEKAARPDFRPVNISIIDVIGVFLPGLVWTVLLTTVGILVSQPTNRGLSPVGIALTLIKDQPTSSYVALALLALLAGFIVKPSATRLSEIFCSLDAFWKPGPRKDHRFPYDAEFRSQPYFKKVEESITSQLGFSPDLLPGHGAASAAKRLLRLMSPLLWEECEHREAEVRMIGSLFLAALFSSCAASIQLIRAASAISFRWFVASLLAAIVLGYSMRTIRRAEVKYVYLNFLIATRSAPFPEALIAVTASSGS
jgi:hypothetical protein